MLINFAVGAFRFLSSSKDPIGYELKTATATMGVRGTVFDFYVTEKGAMVVLMHRGALDVCAVGCKLHNRLGQLAYITRSGKVILRKCWDRKLLPGVSIKQAFPFLGTNRSSRLQQRPGWALRRRGRNNSSRGGKL